MRNGFRNQPRYPLRLLQGGIKGLEEDGGAQLQQGELVLPVAVCVKLRHLPIGWLRVGLGFLGSNKNPTSLDQSEERSVWALQNIP